MSYVYIQTQKAGVDNDYHELFTVGFYRPDGMFMSESDYSIQEEAAQRVHYLNGGNREVKLGHVE